MDITDWQLTEAAARTGELLERRGVMIVTAESCTGGWVAKALTDRAGSSAYVHSGLVTYSNSAKQGILAVTEHALAEHGAVSEAVVREMVAGALAVTGADLAVAVSGIAGPGGGSQDKPVGTVWFAWGSGPERTEASVVHFPGGRDQVRRQAVLYALEGVEKLLQNA